MRRRRGEEEQEVTQGEEKVVPECWRRSPQDSPASFLKSKNWVQDQNKVSYCECIKALEVT